MKPDDVGLPPEIWDISPFCIEANTTKEVEVRLLVHRAKPLPSKLLVLQGKEVLSQSYVEGGQNLVRFSIKSCPPGFLNVVVFAESSPTSGEGHATACRDASPKDGQEQFVQSHMASAGTLPVLPKESAQEMMRIFNDTANLAKECSLPKTVTSSDFLLPMNHKFTEDQERVIKEMLRRKHFRPFAADLEFVLNHSSLLDPGCIPSTEEVSQTTELIRNMVLFLRNCEAWNTLSYALNVWHGLGVDMINDDWKLSAEELRKKSQVDIFPGNGFTPGLYVDHAQPGMEVEDDGAQHFEEDTQSLANLNDLHCNVEGKLGSVVCDQHQGFYQLPEAMPMGSEPPNHGKYSCLLVEPHLSWPDAPVFDKPFMEGKDENYLDKGPMRMFESPKLTLQGLACESSSLEVLGVSDEAVMNSGLPQGLESEESGPEDLQGEGVVLGCEVPVIPPSFASALLSTENTSLSMAIATLLVTCWLYLVWGEWSAVVRLMMVGGGGFLAFVYWTREVQFQYRRHMIWASRLAVILLLWCHGAGWCRCPCVCSTGLGGQCQGGILQSLFWLFTSASAYQLRIVRQVGLFVVEGLAFLYSMSIRSPGCNGVSVMGLVLAGEVISLMMSLLDRQDSMYRAKYSSSVSTYFASEGQKTKTE